MSRFWGGCDTNFVRKGRYLYILVIFRCLVKLTATEVDETLAVRHEKKRSRCVRHERDSNPRPDKSILTNPHSKRLHKHPLWWHDHRHDRLSKWFRNLGASHSDVGLVWGMAPSFSTISISKSPQANYQFTPYIAETANTFSNFFSIWIALHGIHIARQQSLPTRYLVGFAVRPISNPMSNRLPWHFVDIRSRRSGEFCISCYSSLWSPACRRVAHDLWSKLRDFPVVWHRTRIRTAGLPFQNAYRCHWPLQLFVLMELVCLVVPPQNLAVNIHEQVICIGIPCIIRSYLRHWPSWPHFARCTCSDGLTTLAVFLTTSSPS